MKWLPSAISRQSSDAAGLPWHVRLQNWGGAVAPRITKVLGIFVMIGALKLGILVFMGLDMLLPEPPATHIVIAPISAPVPAMAQQPAPAQPAAATPPKAAESPVAATPDAQALLKRQDELDQREQALKTLEADLNTRVAKLKGMENNLKTMLEEAKGVKDQKLKHLIDVYSNMNAKQAAKVLETLDNGIAVKILAGMRGRQAGEVLNNMEAKKAAELTEMLTKVQLPPLEADGPGGPQ